MRSLFRHFFHTVFFSRYRQPLLLIAAFGLFLSSFALLVLQSMMGGLQQGLIKRSKALEGHAVIEILRPSRPLQQELFQDLNQQGLEFYGEYQVEVLARQGEDMAPVILHGLDLSRGTPRFLKTVDFQDLVLGGSVAKKLGVYPLAQVELISPAHSETLVGEIPRQISASVSDLYFSEMPEIDNQHAWIRLSAVQNLVRSRTLNQIRLFSAFDYRLLRRHLRAKYPELVRLKTWEQTHQTLLGAFRLETTVMVFLFACMAVLVALATNSGMALFFNKVRRDLISAWILGLSPRRLIGALWGFFIGLSTLACLLGLGLGSVFLWVFDSFDLAIMPDIFVNQRIPVDFTWEHFALSFFIPVGISLIFGALALRSMERDSRHLIQHLRQLS